MLRVLLLFHTLVICLCHPMALPYKTCINRPIHFLTTLTKQYGATCKMLHSAFCHGITVELLCYGTKWKRHDKFHEKMGCLWRKVLTLPPGDLVYFFDGADAFFMANQTAIKETFCRFGALSVWSSERFCFPYCKHEPWPRGPTPYHFLNVGGVVATVQGMKLVLALMYENIPKGHDWGRFNDQGEVQRHFLQKGSLLGMTLDYNQTIVQNMFDAKKDFCNLPEFRNCLTGSTPHMIHFNGQSMKLKNTRMKEMVPFMPWFNNPKCSNYQQSPIIVRKQRLPLHQGMHCPASQIVQETPSAETNVKMSSLPERTYSDDPFLLLPQPQAQKMQWD